MAFRPPKHAIEALDRAEVQQSVNVLTYRVDGALKVQGFRRVAVELLNEAGDIVLDAGNAPEPLIRAIQGIRTDTDWGEIGHRLALLRRLGDFWPFVYVAARKDELRIVIVLYYGTSPTDDATWKGHFHFLWDLIRNMEDAIQIYEVSPQLQASITSLLESGALNVSPIVSSAATLLSAALEVHRASAGPGASFIGVNTAGVTQDLAKKLNWGTYNATTWKMMSPFPFMMSMAIDVPGGRVLGNQVPQALDLKAFVRNLEVPM